MRVLGVCGGNGVILHPLKEFLIANIEPRAIFATPNNVQWRLNFGEIPLYKNLKDFIKVDVIVGAPDCGHSSILSYSRAKKFSNARENVSLNMFFDSIWKYSPNFFLMENLPALLEQIPLEELQKNFPDYNIIPHISSVADFGNSQKTRIRLLLIGYKRKFGRLTFPIKKQNIPKHAGKLIKGLLKEDVKLCNVREDINSVITMYAGFKLSLKEAKNRWRLELSNSKRWLVSNKKFTTAPGVYKNLKHDYPATARKMNRQFNHWGLTMTPRELARIQGVPDTFKLYYDDTRRQYCINKARATVTKTPPYEIGLWYKECLTKFSGYGKKSCKEKRDLNGKGKQDM